MPGATDDQIAAIPGWFQGYDVDLSRLLLTASEQALGPGDLAELGVYLGKSAALIGSYAAADETFTVVDLFGGDPSESANAAENHDQDPDLSRRAFERWYLTVNNALPTVVEGSSGSITEHAAHGAHRFVHVDASHLYEHVAADVVAACTLLAPDGIVVFDDFRSEHTPGVSAAVWGAVATAGLHPFAMSPVKLYATFGDAARWYAVVADWVRDSPWMSETQQIAGQDVLRLWWASGSERTGAASGISHTPSLAHRALQRARRVAGGR